MEIKDLSHEALICQLAEEAAELAAACNKYLRKVQYPENPTPKSLEECKAAVVEEMADVFLCRNALEESGWHTPDVIIHRAVFKNVRWKKRVNEVQDGTD